MPKRGTTWFAFFFLIVVVFILFFVSVSSKELVKGRVVYTSSNRYLSAPIDGVIDRIFRDRGSQIKQTDRILSLRSSRHESETGDTVRNLILSLDKRREHVSARFDAQSEQLFLERRNIEAKLAGLKQEGFLLSDQIRLLEGSIKLQDNQLGRTTDLANRGYLSKAAVDEKEREMVVVQLQFNEARRALASNKITLNELSSQLKLTGKKLQQHAADRALELESIAFQKSELELKVSAYIVAPDSGVVDTVLVKVGDEVKQGQRLASIRKSSEEYSIELDVPSTAVGFVTIGQRVDIRYDAFPFLKYGVGIGEILYVGSSSASSQGDPERRTPVIFRVIATASPPARLTKGTPFSLKDQMDVQVEITTFKKPVYAWLFDPIIAAKRHINQ